MSSIIIMMKMPATAIYNIIPEQVFGMGDK